MKTNKKSGLQLNADAITQQDAIDAKLDNRIKPSTKDEAHSMMHRADVRHDRALSAVACGDAKDASAAIATAEWAEEQYRAFAKATGADS